MMRPPEPAMPEQDQPFLARVIGHTADLAEAFADFQEKVEAQISRTDALLDRHEKLCQILGDELAALLQVLDAAPPPLQQSATMLLRRLCQRVADV
jgi:hypothetical protein